MSKTFKDSKQTKLGRSKVDKPKPKMEPYKRSSKIKDY